MRKGQKMKKLALYTFALIIFSLLLGCSSEKNNTQSMPDSEISTSITSGKSDVNDGEVFELGNEAAKHLQDLYLDYLQYGYSKLSISIDLHDIITNRAVDENGYIIFEFYNRVTSDTSLDELVDSFNEFCTSEFSNRLLTDTTHSYSNFNGELYVLWKDGAVSGFLESRIDSYIIDGNTITFYFVSETDGDLIGKSMPDGIFTMTLIEQNNNWLISDCSNVNMLGYYYRN
jgi:hypothetical protein